MQLAQRAAERPLEDRVGVAAGLERHRRQMLAVAVPCLAAGIRLDGLELVPEAPPDRREHAQRLFGDLRPDAVAAQDCDREVHAGRVAGRAMGDNTT